MASDSTPQTTIVITRQRVSLGHHECDTFRTIRVSFGVNVMGMRCLTLLLRRCEIIHFFTKPFFIFLRNPHENSSLFQFFHTFSLAAGQWAKITNRDGQPPSSAAAGLDGRNLSFEIFDIPWLSQQLQTDALALDCHRVY